MKKLTLLLIGGAILGATPLIFSMWWLHSSYTRDFNGLMLIFLTMFFTCVGSGLGLATWYQFFYEEGK